MEETVGKRRNPVENFQGLMEILSNGQGEPEAFDPQKTFAICW